MRWFVGAAGAAALLAACPSDGREYRIHLVFPDQASLAATSQVHLWALKTDSGSCADLLAGGQVPASSSVINETTVALPLTRAAKLEDIPPVRVRFLAEGAPPLTGQVLRGCHEMEVRRDAAAEVTIELAWRCAAVADGGPGCYDAGHPDAARPDLVVTDRTRPDRAGSDLVGIDLAEADSARPDATGADRERRDTAGIDLAQPDVPGAELARPDGHVGDRREADTAAHDARITDAAPGDARPADSGGADRPADAGTAAWDRTLPDGCTGADWAQPSGTAVYYGSSAPVFGGAVVDHNDAVHHLWISDYVSRSVHHYWLDTQTSWADDFIDPVQGSQSDLAVASDGTLHAVYSGADSVIKLRHASGTAGNWTSADIPGAVVGPSGGLRVMDIAVDGLGMPHIAYFENSGGNERPGYARFNGASWDLLPVTDTYDYSSLSIAVDSANRPHVAYRNGNNYLRHAVLDGATWTVTTVESLPVYSGFSLAIDGNQVPHLVYMLYVLPHSMWHAVYNGASWDRDQIWGLSDKAAALSLVFDQANRPHIAHYDTIASDVYHTTWNGTRWCTQFYRRAPDIDGPIVLFRKGPELYLFYFWSPVSGSYAIDTAIRR